MSSLTVVGLAVTGKGTFHPKGHLPVSQGGVTEVRGGRCSRGRSTSGSYWDSGRAPFPEGPGVGTVQVHPVTGRRTGWVVGTPDPRTECGGKEGVRGRCPRSQSLLEDPVGK